MDITTRRGLGKFLRDRYGSEERRRAYIEELIGHELGHSLGFHHTCGDEDAGRCTTMARQEALMRATNHGDGRGARLSSDDRAILRLLYPAPPDQSPLQAPTNVSATPIDSTTLRVKWRDRSHDEDGFNVVGGLEGAAGWRSVARTAANVEEAVIYDLRPGSRYGFFVSALRGDNHADSVTVSVTMPSGPTKAGTLQNGKFTVEFEAEATSRTSRRLVIGRAAGWSSDKGVLYWLFDAENPEALVKVLDGRGVNGHWWLDLAVTSDLPTFTTVVHRVTGHGWRVWTGRASDGALAHCASPAYRSDNPCTLVGYGSTFSLRDAWDSSGRIPSKYLGASSASANGDRAEAGLRLGLFRRADGSHGSRVTAEQAGALFVPPPVSSVAAEATLHGAAFAIAFGAEANDDSTVSGRAARWSSEKGVLYWLFDSENPEALVKVLDGRGVNGHWWLDLAVTSDLPTSTTVVHRVTGHGWNVWTGRASDGALAHCASPAYRSDNPCTLGGYGSTLSLRDAWDSSGRIPSKYYE